MLGVRASDLLRVHDARGGRPSLPRALREAPGRAEGHTRRRARRHRRQGPSRQHGHDDADRDQRRRLHARARRRRDDQRHRQLALQPRVVGAQRRLPERAGVLAAGERGRAGRRPRRLRARRVVADLHADVPPLRPAPPRDEHVQPVLRGLDPRVADRPLAVPAPVHRLGARGLRRRVPVEPESIGVGASGAIFGVLGALYVLERRGTSPRAARSRR